jgi:hypothetical protein
MAKQQINPAQTKVVRNNNGTTGVVQTQREIGWSNFQYNGTPSVAPSVTFKNAFPAGVIPIVLVSFAGDNSATYGSGANASVGRATIKVTAVSNTGFTYYWHTADGANAPSGTQALMTYMAEA